MQSSQNDISPQEASLVSEGWQNIDAIECNHLEPGKLYAIENENESREVYFSEEGKLLISSLPNLESPYECHEIKTASLVKEI